MTDYEKGEAYFSRFISSNKIELEIDFTNEEFRRGYNDAHDEYIEQMHGRIEYGK